MMEQRIRVEFVTPAFLGDARQQGAWRTPPFKALLRQWWRVRAAQWLDYDHRRVREAEGRIFGHAWLTDEAGKRWALQSRVRLRLERWAEGGLRTWPKDPRVEHPEVGEKGRKIGAHLYLGYGPLEDQQGVTRLKNAPAIGAGEQCELVLAYPERLHEEVTDALQLVAWFGTLGGRSRNGWGSLALVADGLKGLSAMRAGDALLGSITRPLPDCLRLDWPHALGSDEKGLLVWRTRQPLRSWEEAMTILAQVKIAVRRRFPFRANRDINGPLLEERHLLAYPVTNHGVLEWSKTDEKTGKPLPTPQGKLNQDARLANQVRFKVHPEGDGYVGLVFHVPCGLPKALLSRLDRESSWSHSSWDQERKLPKALLSRLDRETVRRLLTPDGQAKVWKLVHQELDGHPELERALGAPR